MKTKLYARLLAFSIAGTCVSMNVNAQTSGTSGFWDLKGNSAINTGINFIGTTDAKNLNIRTNNLTRVTVAATTGFVGIGNTAPGFSLDVKNDSNCTVRLKSAVFGSSNMVIDRSAAGQNCLVNYRTAGTTNWQTGCLNNTDFIVSNAAVGKAITVLVANNNVGIGTATPSTKLHVVGGGRFDGSVWVDGANTNTGTTLRSLQFGDSVTTGEAIASKRTAGGNQNGLDFYTGSVNRMLITNAGKVGIGTAVPAEVLDVTGNIKASGRVSAATLRVGTTTSATGYIACIGGKLIAEEVRVDLKAVWPDYVFGNDYKLMSLDELEKNINTNKHLPGLPGAETMKTQGITLGEMQTKTIEKVEELTLYLIQLKKENDELRARIEILEKK